jgi:hypothetical protein
MHTTKYKKFKGEIENYVTKGSNIFESRIDRIFQSCLPDAHYQNSTEPEQNQEEGWLSSGAPAFHIDPFADAQD